MSLRSKYIPQKRSITRHIKRIAEVSMPVKAPEEDLLSQLRKYRRNKSRNSVNVESLSKTEKNLGAYNRPGSAGNTANFFNTVRTQEVIPAGMPSERKKNSSNNLMLLEQSVDRLYRGSRPQTQAIDLQKSALFQLADVVCEKKIQAVEESLKASDEKTNKAILNDLNFLKPLIFDLDLNWETARGKELAPNESRLGVFYALEEKLKSPANIGPTNYFTLDPILKELKECSRLFRDILRGIMTKGAEDEGVLMEMLWKVIFKIIDQCLAKHEYSLNSVIECTKSKLKIVNETYKLQTLKQTEEFHSQITALEKQLAANHNQIQNLTLERNEYSRLANEKSRTIIELTEIESQEKACIELRSLLGKLSSYITESETEQNTQVATLNHLSFVIKAADILREKPKMVNIETQTNLQVSESFLPELQNPVFSKYPLFPVLIINAKVSKKLNAVTLCTSAFEECDGQKQFYIELIMFLLSMYKDKNTLFQNLQGIYQHLLTDQSIQARFYLTLLNNSKKSVLKIEQNMFKLSSLFEKNSESGVMNFIKFIEFLQNFLPEEKHFCEEVLEKVTQNFMEKDWKAIIQYRLAMPYEKIPKNIRVLIEHDGLTFHEFLDWAKNKLMVWATEKEIKAFFDSQSAPNANLWFAVEVPERIRELRIDKENFLLCFMKVSLKKFNRCEEDNKKIENISEFLQFKEVLAKENKEISERLATNCFAEVLLGTPYEEVQEKVLDYDFSGLKISDSPRGKKRPPPKSPKKGKK